MSRTLLSAVLCIGMLTSISLAAQSTDATLSGSVTDPSAAPVTGSIVTVLSLSTGVVSTTKTNASGVYLFPALPPGTYRLTADTHGVVGRVIGGWQAGAIFNRFSGQPMAASAVSTGLGSLVKTGNSVIYFANLRQVPDPFIASITTLGGLQGRSTMRAITDAAGNLIMVNPAPGQFGNVGQNNIEGPGATRLDVNVIKRVSITERIELQLRADAINLTNTPQFANPTTDINSTTFGRITATATGSTPRLVVLQMRVSF